MKKLLFTIIIFSLSISSSFASFFVNGGGNYMYTGGFIPVYGFEGGAGFSLNENINFLLDGSYALSTENDNDKINKKKYVYKFYTGGIEYIPTLDIFEKNNIYWKNTLSVGASTVSRKGHTGGANAEDQHSGLFTMFKTGLQYNFTQVISPYFDLGYHKTFFNTAKTSLSIGGLEFDFGVRFYIFGNRDFESGY